MTAEPTTPLPESPHCRVRARVASIWADGPDAGTSPDWRPAAGEKVTLTPSISSQLLVYDAAGPDPIIVTVERVGCVVDEEGWLTKSDGRPVFIAPTDDPLLSATGWTWTATIKGKSIAFSAPAGGVVDLALYVATPAVDATEYVSVVQIVADYIAANPPDVEQAVADWLTTNPPAGGGTVHYGADADTPRPVSSQPVIWVGRAGVTPTGAVDYDIVIHYESETGPPPTPPSAAPTLTVAATSGSSIDGTISPLMDATGYEWVHEPGIVTGAPSAAAVDIGAQLSFSATGLDTSSTYTFWARGYNGDGAGPWSEPQTATTTAPLLGFVEDFNISPPEMQLHNDPRWASLISTPVWVYNDDPTYGDYVGITRGSSLIAAQVDPVAAPFPPNQWAEADVANLRNFHDARAIVYTRATGAGDHYYGELNHNGGWKLASVVAGVETTLASGSMTRPEYPYTQRLEVKGSQITLLIGGDEIATATNSDHTTGQPGLGFYRAEAAVTEFRAGELP